MSFINSSTWQAVKKQLEQDRIDLVEQLVKRASLQDTDIIRGKIQQLDDILDGYPSRLTKSDT